MQKVRNFFLLLVCSTSLGDVEGQESFFLFIFYVFYFFGCFFYVHFLFVEM